MVNEDELPPAPGSPQAEERAVEAAAIRRRWITLGELLAVIAAIISALTLWNSWSERNADQAGKQAEARRESNRAATLLLTASAAGDRLTLQPAAAEQSVQGQVIAFPAAVGVAPVETTGEARIEAGWFEDALKKARSKSGLSDESRGDERLPVAITTRFLADGEPHEDVALYDVGYSISGGGLLSGRKVTLRGVSLVSRVKRGSPQAMLDARWNRLFPAKQPGS